MDSLHKLDQLTVVVLLSYYHFLPDLTHQSTSKFLPSEARFQNLLSWRKQKEDEHLKSDREGGWNVEGSGFFSCPSANKQGRWFGEQGVASPPSFLLLSGLLPAFMCKKPIDQGAHSGVSTTLISVTHFNPNYISPSESLKGTVIVICLQFGAALQSALYHSVFPPVPLFLLSCFLSFDQIKLIKRQTPGLRIVKITRFSCEFSPPTFFFTLRIRRHLLTMTIFPTFNLRTF